MIRAARYIMDIYFGVFEWSDLFSLHICHIDLILLVICLIKTNKTIFHYCFLVGIPMGLAVALFPGSNHPAPGLPRAILFIMSHTMLVIGALYLASVVRLRLNFKVCAGIAAAGSLFLIPLYYINTALSANYLYIMRAPEGTVIEGLEKMFGWPGYVFAMDFLALSLILLMFLIGRFISSDRFLNMKKRLSNTHTL